MAYGYWTICNDCKERWEHDDNICPECGSGDTDEGHLIECECKDCRNYKH